MKLKSLFIYLCVGVAIFSSCDRNVNDWTVEAGEDRLFKPLIFEASTLRPTSIQIKHTKVLDAATYLFEFSKDENFAEIVKEVVILADTLTEFAPSNTMTKIEYRTWFDGLDGTSDYWVRMRAENADGSLQSKYSVFQFTTPAEQIFKRVISSVNTLTFVWEPTDRVTNIVLWKGEKESADDETKVAEIENHTLTNEEKEAGSYTFKNLEMGESYIAKIFNNDILRGTYNSKTFGIAGSTIYEVPTNISVGDLSGIVADMAATGKQNITLYFAPGEEYEMDGTIIIPAGVKNFSFVGSQDNDGTLSQLNNVYFAIETEIENVDFQNLRINSNGGFTFQIGAQKFHNLTFESCDITNVNSVVRLHSGAVGDYIKFNNCIISHTGGWSFLNVGSGCTINKIDVMNSTLSEFNTRIADIRVKVDIRFKNVTLVNIEEKMTHLWLLDNNSRPTLVIEDCIFAGPNGGQKLHSTNGNYGNISISYGGSYKTNDLIEDSRPLTDITEVPLDVYGLFENPANGDFHIKKGVGFAGTGVAGDPRWFD